MKTEPRASGVATTLAIAALLLGCTSKAPSGEALDPELEKLVLSAVPSDIEHPAFVDFGGKVHLVGYDLEPETRAAPRSTLTLKLYWRPVGRLSEGWKVYTHLAGAEKDERFSFDDAGVLRQKLPPNRWAPGNVYVDEQVITVPADVTSRELVLTVGFEHDPVTLEGNEKEGLAKHRLEILSGISDGEEGALIARLPTGVSGRKGKRGSRRRGAEGDRAAKPAAGRRPTLGRKLLDRAGQGAGN